MSNLANSGTCPRPTTGGNREKFATPWNYPQPSWSALREDAYRYS